METYVKKAEDLDAVNENFMPPLLDAILGDYANNSPGAREAEVLNVMATITGRLEVIHRLIFTNFLAKPCILGSPHPSSACHLGRRVRTYAQHDQQRFYRVPRTSRWFLQAVTRHQSLLL
jgi:hypothetical protein